MPVINSIASYADELTAWRQHIHAHPELGFDCHETAKFVADRLREFGVDEIHEGIATSGVVGIIRGKGQGPAIGLRADMDALPMDEMTGLPYASTVPGRMHACGHDGHTTMLLGAARYLAETRNFSGSVALIFQPAEESGGGGEVMCREGIMERFGVSQVYAMHNSPDYEAGTFSTRVGPMMAAVDEFTLTVRGRGGHAAYPHMSIDPVAAALQLGQNLNTIVSRNADPLDNIVVSLTVLRAGTVSNIIPETMTMTGTIRTYTPQARDMAERRLREISAGIAAAMGVGVDVDYSRWYPATVNHADQTAFAIEVAKEIAGEALVNGNCKPEMGAEDFSYMLEERPGAYVYLGQGKGPMCHHQQYNFNDEVLPVGASFFARLVERAQPV